MFRGRPLTEKWGWLFGGALGKSLAERLPGSLSKNNLSARLFLFLRATQVRQLLHSLLHSKEKYKATHNSS